jgi:hypothetical protein
MPRLITAPKNETVLISDEVLISYGILIADGTSNDEDVTSSGSSQTPYFLAARDDRNLLR